MIFGKNLNATLLRPLDRATKKLATGDISDFVVLVKKIPSDQRQEVVSSGLISAFKERALSKDLSFSKYANWYEGLLKNKKAYTALMANLPKGGRKKLSDFYRVSKAISRGFT